MGTQVPERDRLRACSRGRKHTAPTQSSLQPIATAYSSADSPLPLAPLDLGLRPALPLLVVPLPTLAVSGVASAVAGRGSAGASVDASSPLRMWG